MSFVTFGEIMLRLTPSNHGAKINSAATFGVNYAGSESNVASSLGVLKNKVDFVTKLPDNQLGDAAISSLQGYGINTSHIIKGGKRIGTYFIEIGSSIRPSSVIYDRADSAISHLKEGELDWEAILKNKEWIFLSGITPVLSKQCAAETIKAAQTAHKLGVKVAFDMNYRRSLWKSSDDARVIFDEILKYTDLLFGNAGVLVDVYGMKFSGNNSTEKTLDAAIKAQQKFNIKQLAFTVRDHISASENKLSGIILSGDKHIISNTYNVEITDRFGTGDSFAAACLHGLSLGWEEEKIINFSTAAFALKHTIQGDQHTSSEKEIISIMEGNTSGHVLR